MYLPDPLFYQEIKGVLLWLSGLKIQYCHCSAAVGQVWSLVQELPPALDMAGKEKKGERLDNPLPKEIIGEWCQGREDSLKTLGVFAFSETKDTRYRHKKQRAVAALRIISVSDLELHHPQIIAENWSWIPKDHNSCQLTEVLLYFYF